MSQTVADVVVGVLEQIGVKHIFALIGDSLNPLADAVRRTDIEWIGVRHEEGAALAASGLVNVSNDMTIAREEIFGPVLGVIAYDSDEDAIRIANDSNYGLHAAVLGTDLSRARRVASQLRAGRVVINGMTDDPQAPWGGFKFSGVGREYGAYGISAFLETRAILEVA
jgi:NAD-dependent aldehyde dehydrogenases